MCVCVCSSDPCPALPGPANLLEQRAGLLHGAGVTCLSYRISRSRSGCSQLQENIAQRRGGGGGGGGEAVVWTLYQFECVPF